MCVNIPWRGLKMLIINLKTNLLSKVLRTIIVGPGGGALEWQEGVSGSSMDTQKAP